MRDDPNEAVARDLKDTAKNAWPDPPVLTAKTSLGTWREYASANPKPMTTTGLFHLKR